MSAELPNWVLEVRPPSGGCYTIFLDLGSWCVKRGRYGDPTLRILFKGTKEDAESYVNFLAAAEAPVLEILTELRSMLKARKAQPALPMECEP